MSGCNHEKCLRDGCERCCYCSRELIPKPEAPTPWDKCCDNGKFGELHECQKQPAKDAGARELWWVDARKREECRTPGVAPHKTGLWAVMVEYAAYEKLERELAESRGYQADSTKRITLLEREIAEAKAAHAALVAESQKLIVNFRENQDGIIDRLTQERAKSAALVELVERLNRDLNSGQFLEPFGPNHKRIISELAKWGKG